MDDSAETIAGGESSGTINVAVRTDLLARQPRLVSIEGGLTALHEELAALAELFHANKDNERQATWRSIAAVEQFLMNVGVPFEAMVPLTQAAETFASPTKRSGGRPRKPMRAQVSEGLLAAIAELAVRDFRQRGLRPYEKPALKHAVSLLKKEWNVKISTSRLGELRNTVSALAGKRKKTLETLVWHEALSSPLAGTHPAIYLRALLHHNRAALHISG